MNGAFDTLPRIGLSRAIAAIMLATGVALAGPVPVPLANPSFESPVLPANNNWSSPIQGWNNSGPPSPGVTFKIGSMPPASNGRQYAWCDLADFDLTQYVGSIDGNARYELSVDLWVLDSTNASAQVRLGDLTVGRYMVERLYRPAWNTNLVQFPLLTGQWTTVSASFHGDDFPGINGHTLVVNIHGSRLAVDNVRLFKTVITNAPAATYYVSSTTGNDANTGLSPASAWRSFTNVNDRRFAAGSSIFLKHGDVWRQELSLRGSGSPASTNQVGGYGSGARPLILRADKDFDRCIVLNNASFWRVADVECRNACLGVFLRYFESVGYRGITVENCHFGDLDSWAIDPQVHSMEWAVPAAIWVGGIIKSGDENATVLDGLTIRNCGMENCTAGIGTGYYYPPSQPARVTHLTIEDSYATRVTIGGLSCDSVSQAVVRRFRTFERHGRPGGIWTGSTGVMLTTCADFLFEDCEFSETDRAWSDPSQGDGCGFDFERSVVRVTFRRCLFHDNDGPGILTLSTAGGVANTNLLIQDSTFWNDALDPQDATYSPGGNACEIKFSSGTAYGTVTNCGFYRSVTASNWFYPSPMTSAIKLLNNRTLRWTNFMTLPGAPAWEWNTNGNFEGWTNRNQWLSPAVSGGEFSGTAQGNDPYAYSPKLWVNTRRASPSLRLRMRSTAGAGALYFITEADSVWAQNKLVGIPVIADGTWHEYRVDLRVSVGYGGVVTQLRLDPSDTAGAQFAVDWVRWQPDVSAGSLQLLSLDALGARLRFTGDPGARLRALASSDLLNWIPFRTNTADAQGQFEFADAGALGATRRFYRVVWP
jgi:hypothetical protein